MMRLQKYLALAGVASRRNAEKLIAAGRVTVNGKTVTEMGVQVDETADRITVGGEPVQIQQEKYYIAYHKPMGEVTTVSDPEGRPTVMDRFPDFPARIYPVGRLDYDSEGLLLLTNDGDVMQRLLHPSREIPKQYLTRAVGFVSDEEIARLRAGVMLDGRLTSPAEVVMLKRFETYTLLLITIHEGRNRQVRRMLKEVGHDVAQLKRTGFGPILLGDLPRGMWRRLTGTEVAKIKRQCGL